MPALCDRNYCTGCAACYSACPRNAISMLADAEGFLSPEVVKDRCVDCGKCEEVCPVLHFGAERKPLGIYAAKSKNQTLRLESSSGGVFSLLAKAVIDAGGSVFGAAVVDGYAIRHVKVEMDAQLARLRGSKYVQSEIGDSYREARMCLSMGKRVLFSGTPCQIAGFRNFLGREYRSLLCVDVVCHAVASPLAWQKYLEWINPDPFAFESAKFRDKTWGWRRYSMRLRKGGGSDYCKSNAEDPFLKGFSSELFSRESCYNCCARNLKSGADITLGDFWRVWEEKPQIYDNQGVSLVLVNTEQGMSAFRQILADVVADETDFQVAVKVNPSIVKRPSRSSQRHHKFFSLLERGMSFYEAVEFVSRRSWADRVRGLASRILKFK